MATAATHALTNTARDSLPRPWSAKLTTTCEGVVEATWLVALVTIPLFFNPLSGQTFEADKMHLLRSLAIVTVGCRASEMVCDALPLKLASPW